MTKLTTNDILAKSGIVIRLIPETTVTLSAYHEKRQPLSDEKLVEINGRKMLKRTKLNSLGGKYLITFASNQDSTVRFDLKRNGIGETIVQAYQDYLVKNKLD